MVMGGGKWWIQRRWNEVNRKVVIVLCVTGLVRVGLVMASLVGFNWVVNMPENPVPNNQDKSQNQNVDPAKWPQI